MGFLTVCRPNKLNHISKPRVLKDFNSNADVGNKVVNLFLVIMLGFVFIYLHQLKSFILLQFGHLKVGYFKAVFFYLLYDFADVDVGIWLDKHK